MIKTLIFDLDGPLVSSKILHFEAFNKALRNYYKSDKYVLTLQEHLSLYDGLPTKQKLQQLSLNKKLPESDHIYINTLKQRYTKELLETTIHRNIVLENVLKQLKIDGYKLFLATNSIRETTNIILKRLGIIEYFDYIATNEDIAYPKPHPQIYLKCIYESLCKPSECLIFEDSPHGLEAANESGANFTIINDVSQITYDNIVHIIETYNKHTKHMKWKDEKLNILIPCAGAGSRFEKAGYTFPKPIIDVLGKPMIQLVIESLQIEANYIYLFQKHHLDKYNIKSLVNLLTPNSQIVEVDKLTEGAACTTLLAKNLIDNDNPLIIVNSDQYIKWNSTKFMYKMINQNADVGILTFENNHPKWSYVKTDEYGLVKQVAEKNVISNEATVGLYYWKHGKDYIWSAEEMIQKNIRTNNEFYVAPSINELIQIGKKILTYKINSDDMAGLGTPEDLNYFINHYKNV